MRFSSRRRARSISDAALSGTLLREFNESTFSLLTDSAMAAVAAAEQFPMLSERRVVRIKDFAKLRELDEEVLIRYLERPADSTVMIFVADDLDKRKKLTRTLLPRPSSSSLPVRREAKSWRERFEGTETTRRRVLLRSSGGWNNPETLSPVG